MQMILSKRDDMVIAYQLCVVMYTFEVGHCKSKAFGRVSKDAPKFGPTLGFSLSLKPRREVPADKLLELQDVLAEISSQFSHGLLISIDFLSLVKAV
jgi:hypothetical protein